ncbi:MAG: FAD-dependent oxidoreductase, partial [Chlamydiales bacterium]
MFKILLMEEISCDFAVIGSGPAGQKGAIQAAKLKKSVVLIEKNIVVGGNCLNSGTIPSKSLREAIIDLTRYNERSFYGSSCLTEVTIHDLNYRLNTVLEGERAILLRQLRKNKIRLIGGSASFVNGQELLVKNEEVSFRILAKKILIATGSEPRNPL